MTMSAQDTGSPRNDAANSGGGSATGTQQASTSALAQRKLNSKVQWASAQVFDVKGCSVMCTNKKNKRKHLCKKERCQVETRDAAIAACKSFLMQTEHEDRMTIEVPKCQGPMRPAKLSALTKLADGNPMSHIEKTVVRLPEDACTRMLSDLGAPSMTVLCVDICVLAHCARSHRDLARED